MRYRLIVAILAVFGMPLAAAAQDFPSHAITMIVPFAPGSGMDFILQNIQSRWEAALGQPLIVDHKPGATGNIGNAYVAKSAPDGYTLLFTQVNIGVLPHVFSHLAYDPLKDFAAVGGVAETPGVCVAKPDFKDLSFADIIAKARDNPGKIKFGSTGNGAPSQLMSEMIGKFNNVKFTHVPYKGPLPALNDLLGNFIDFMCLPTPNPLSFIRSGMLKPLVVTSGKRTPVLPDVPTVKEAGVGDMDESQRYIFLAPAATPKPVMDRLSTTLAKILADPAIAQTLIGGGFEVSHTTPAEVLAQIQQQNDIWGPFVKELNLKLD